MKKTKIDLTKLIDITVNKITESQLPIESLNKVYF